MFCKSGTFCFAAYKIILDRIFIQIRHHTCIRKSGCRYIKYRSDTVSGSILQLIIHLGTPHHTRIKQDKIKLLRIYRTQHFRQFRYQRCVTGIPPAILSYRTGAGNSGQPSRTVRSKDYSITFRRVSTHHITYHCLHDGFLRRCLRGIFFSDVTNTNQIIDRCILISHHCIYRSFRQAVDTPLTIGYIFYDTRLRPTDIRSLTIPIYQ